MRIPSPIALAAAAAMVAASLAPAGATAIRGPLHQTFGRHHSAMAVPGKANQLIGRHPLANLGARSWMRNDRRGGCIYVSDNLSGVVSVYSNKSPYGLIGTLTSSSLYGWGAAMGGKKTTKVAYLGTYSNTVDFYVPCSGTAPTGSVSGSQGSGYYAYGMTVGNNGNLYIAQWPSNFVDYYTAPVTSGESPTVAQDTGQALTYFVEADNNDTYLTGYNTSETQETVDACSLTVSGCATIVSISGGFPGASQIDNAGNLYVNNQFGTLYAYSGCPSACTANGSFTYSNGTNPLDYTATALDKKAHNLWGANIYYCSSSYGLCGDAQSQSLPLSSATLNGNTPQLSNSEPLGLAIWPHDKV